MKRKYILTAATAIITVILIRIGMHFFHTDYSSKNIKVGFVYIGDAGTPYTNNFVRSQNELEKQFPANVTTIAKYNIPEENCEPVIRDIRPEEIYMGAASLRKHAPFLQAAFSNVDS